MSDVKPEPSFDGERPHEIARRLGHDPALVAELYRTSETFREICDHYAMCREMFERFRKLDDSRVEEYADMRDGLEHELRAALEKGARMKKREEGC